LALSAQYEEEEEEEEGHPLSIFLCFKSSKNKEAVSKTIKGTSGLPITTLSGLKKSSKAIFCPNNSGL
jgi:hypothetical protein